MPGQYVHPNWTPSLALFPLGISIPSIIYSLYILAYPPSTSLGRKLCILLLAIPTAIVFRYSDHMFPNYDLVDTFGRACLIWFAHMSFEVCVLEFRPVVRQPGQPGEVMDRFRQAYKVFFDRSRAQVLEQQRDTLPTTSAAPSNPDKVYTATDKKTDEPVVVAAKKIVRETGTSHYQHGYSRWQFVRYHVLKAAAMYALQRAWDTYDRHFSPLRQNPAAFISHETVHFFRRLPASLHYKELYYRTEEAFEWNIVTKCFYEGYHSVFAAAHVGLGIDTPEEWSLSLFGPISEAWSVRRYWSRYWHNYIYHSFSGHIKCVTRGWLGMRRGSVLTRLVENTLVFFASGLMHSLVRWQQAPQDDVWAITVFYLAQMIPLVIESVVVYYWRKGKKTMGLTDDRKWLSCAEYAMDMLGPLAGSFTACRRTTW